MCVLGQGILIYLIDMGNGRTDNEASFVAAKSLIGVGRGFYQTASQVSVQAVVSKQELAVVTAVFFASMSVGGAIGTRYAFMFHGPSKELFSDMTTVYQELSGEASFLQNSGSISQLRSRAELRPYSNQSLMHRNTQREQQGALPSTGATASLSRFWQLQE